MLTVSCEESLYNYIKGVKGQYLLVGCKVSDIHYHVISATPNDSNIGEKAKQISCTLPGGMYILGVAMDTNPKQLRNQLGLVRGLLASIWKNSLSVGGDKGAEHSLLIYYSQESKKLRSLSVNINDTQSSLQLPGTEVKSSSRVLIMGLTYLSFKMRQVVAGKTTSVIMTDTVSQCMDNIREAVAVYEGIIPKDSDSVLEFTKDNQVEVTFSWKPIDGEMDAPVLMDDGLSVSVEDGVQCKAFIDSKGTWQQLTEALKDDAMKTLSIRKEALLAELEEGEKGNEEEEGETKSRKSFKLMFPRRIWFRDNEKHFELSEILFPGEEENEAKENLMKIWGEGMQLSLSSHNNCEVIKPLPTIKGVSQSTKDVTGHKNSNLCYYLVAAVVLLLALVLVILLL